MLVINFEIWYTLLIMSAFYYSSVRLSKFNVPYISVREEPPSKPPILILVWILFTWIENLVGTHVIAPSLDLFGPFIEVQPLTHL